MIIEIQDDFNLRKIIDSGQCFQVKYLDDGYYRFVSGSEVLYIREMSSSKFDVSCDETKWDTVWHSFFDLDRSYESLVSTERGKHPFVDITMDFGRGLRILRQDPWEILITFILSQRKSIPAISKSIAALTTKFGHPIDTAIEEIYSFPTPADLASATDRQLSECGLGYRTKYVSDAARKVNEGLLNLDRLSELPDNLLLDRLQQVYGVGEKVANCVALFSYGRTSCVPIDVWISKAIENECHGVSPFALYPQNAGIIQQYIFYYVRCHQQQ